jgi:hypothetical protein
MKRLKIIRSVEQKKLRNTHKPTRIALYELGFVVQKCSNKIQMPPLDFYRKKQDFQPTFFLKRGEKSAKPYHRWFIKLSTIICPQVLIFISLFCPSQKILSFSLGA